MTLDGVPDIQDVHSLIEILEIMGAKITFEILTLFNKYNILYIIYGR